MQIQKQKLELLIKVIKCVDPEFSQELSEEMQKSSGPMATLSDKIVDKLFKSIKGPSVLDKPFVKSEIFHTQPKSALSSQFSKENIDCYDKIMINVLNYHSPVVKEYRL